MSVQVPDARRRVPGLVWTAWATAVVVLAVLALAVLNHLRGPADSAMSGMDMSPSVGDALTRSGNDPFGPLLSSRLITAWQLDALAVAVLVVAAACYLTALALRRRSDNGVWPWGRTASFLAGLGVIGLATNSSIAVYDMSLFSAHMIGHLMLVMLAPALLVGGRPLTLLLQATTGTRRERIAAAAKGQVVTLLTAPPVALASYTVVIVGSHLTGVMDVVMRDAWAGQVEHLVYVVLGVQFFVLIIGEEPIRWRLSVPARFFLMAVAMAVDTFTGVILLQTTRAIHMTPPGGTNINTLSDTQSGGAIMWFGGDAIMAAVMILLVIGWVRTPEANRVGAGGWLEQARRANFAAHTGAGRVSDETEDDFDSANFDSDEQRLAEYNQWLQKLDQHR